MIDELLFLLEALGRPFKSEPLLNSAIDQFGFRHFLERRCDGVIDGFAVELFLRHRLLQPTLSLRLLSKLRQREIAGIFLIIEISVLLKLYDDPIDDLII